jgi:hypothetical protein
MTRRCKWCIARIDSARLFLNGQWIVAPLMEGEVVTDGICPECLEIELAKLDEPQTA